MAKGRITEDEIKWILSVESTEAQQKIYQLTQRNKELTKANKDRISEMIKLEKQGKRESDEYINLSKIVSKNTVEIKKNKDIISQLEGNMKTSELTMSQLRKRAKDLQSQLDHTAKSTNPEQYNRLEKELSSVHSRMTELRGSAKNVDKSFGGIKSLLPTIGWTSAIASTTALGKASTESALESEQALQRLQFAVLNVAGGSGSDAEKLKKQASSLMGIFDDEDIMQAQTTMINFGMSTRAIIELMPLMVDAAAASGKSLDDMATAVDKGTRSGVMAKSALGQLGITFKDTGDYSKNYALIIKGLSKFVEGNSEALKSNWGEVQNAKVQWGEFKETLGGFLSKGLSPVINGITHLNDLLKSSGQKEVEASERIAEGRLKDFKVYMNQQKDKVGYINDEMKAERNLYKAKQDRIQQIDSLISRNNTLGGSWVKQNKSLEEERNGLQKSVNWSIAYVNKLAGLRQELKDNSKMKFNLFNEDQDNTDPNKDKLKRLDDEAMAEVVAAKKSAKTQEDLTSRLTDIQKKYIQKKRDLYDKDSSEYNDYQSQILDISRASVEKQNADSIKAIQSINASATVSIDQYERHEKQKWIDLLNEKKISKDEYDSHIAATDTSISEWRVQNARDYAELINDTTFNSDEEKKAAVSAATTALNAAEETLQESLKKQAELKVNNEKEYQSNVAKIRQELGLDKEKLSYSEGLEALKLKLKQAEASEKESADAISKYKLEKVAQYGQKASQLASAASNSVQSLQQAELDQIDAKYDVEIAAAKGNTEQIEKLENEKEQKKLDVQKKYADANFAIKVSQIIADTAVSIMKAYADLGPIAGSIAAGLLGVTGAAQLISAKAERDKVKNMTVGSSSSSGSSTGTLTASGLEDGGSIDVTRAQDGKRFRNALYDPSRRGYVDRPTVIVGEGKYGSSREWIASNDAVSNPTIAPLISLIDKHQQAGTIRTLDLNQVIRANMVGYSGGGFIGSKPEIQTAVSNRPSDGYPTKSDDVLKELTVVIKELQENGISADVSLSDLERKQNLRNRARKIGSKK